MARSKRRFTPSSTGGAARPDAPRRNFRPAASTPPAQKPPAGGTPARAPIGPPRPLVPERRSGGGPRLLAMLGAQRLVIGVAAVAVLVALGIVAYAWYADQIEPRRELAVQVGDRSYSMEYFARRYGMLVSNPPQGINLRTGVLTELPEYTRKAIEDESITLQRAGLLGVEAGQNEIDRALVTETLNIPLEAGEGDAAEAQADDGFAVTPAMERTLRFQLQRDGLSLAQLREIAQAELLQRKVRDHFLKDIPSRGPQVRMRVLQVALESDAREAIARIKRGETTLEQLANDPNVNIDPIGKNNGGARDWTPRGILPPAIEQAVFSLPLNTLSEPLSDGGDAWIVTEVLDRSDERDIAENVRNELALKKVDAWYQEQRDSIGIKNAITEQKIRWALTFSGAAAALAAATGSLTGGAGNTPLQLPTNPGQQPPAGQPPAQPPAGSP